MPMTCASVTSSPVRNASLTEPNRVEPMPMITASTMSLMPEVMTFPSTRSARNVVLFQSANGTSTNPASVVSLNSRMVMKSCTASTKKATMITAQATNMIAIVMKLWKKLTGPTMSLISSSRGWPASRPTLAMKPGRRSSAAVMVPPPAVRPSSAKLSKTMLARIEKLPMMNAKKPT